MTYKIPSPKGKFISYVIYCPSVHVLNSIASVDNALYNI